MRFQLETAKHSNSCSQTGLEPRWRFLPGAYHYPDVVPVMERERPIHLQEIVLSFEKAFEILRVENHHQGDVVQAAQRGKRLCKQRVHCGVLLSHLNCLIGEKEQRAILSNKIANKYIMTAPRGPK